MAEASLNRCGLVILVLEFPVVEWWVLGLFGWLFVSGSVVGWLVVLDSGFCGFGGYVTLMGYDCDVGCVGLNFRCGLLWFNAGGCVGFRFWGFWVSRSFFGVYGLWVASGS